MAKCPGDEINCVNPPSPLEPLSVITFCTRAQEPRDQFCDAWGHTFGPVVKTWLRNAPVGERRNFIQALVPNSLFSYLNGAT